MSRLFKVFLYLVGLCVLGLLGFAIFSDLPAPTEDVVVPIPVPED